MKKLNVRNIVTSYPFAAVLTCILFLVPHISDAQTPKSVNPEEHVIAIVGDVIITERDVRLMIPNFNTEIKKNTAGTKSPDHAGDHKSKNTCI